MISVPCRNQSGLLPISFFFSPRLYFCFSPRQSCIGKYDYKVSIRAVNSRNICIWSDLTEDNVLIKKKALCHNKHMFRIVLAPVSHHDFLRRVQLPQLLFWFQNTVQNSQLLMNTNNCNIHTEFVKGCLNQSYLGIRRDQKMNRRSQERRLKTEGLTFSET